MSPTSTHALAPAARRLALIALAIMLVIPALLPLFGCLPFPMGDPETSKADEKILGGWIAKVDDSKEQLYVVRSFNGKSYVIDVFSYGIEGGIPERDNQQQWRGWTTTVGQTNLITLEPRSIKHDLGIEKNTDKAQWVVAKYVFAGDSELKVYHIKPEGELNGVTTREKGEPIIRANVEKDTLYTDTPFVLNKADAEKIATVLDLFKVQ